MEQVEGTAKKDVNRKVYIYIFTFYKLVSRINVYSPLLNYMQLSPLTTLESSFEALNVKKFDGTTLRSLFTCLVFSGYSLFIN